MLSQKCCVSDSKLQSEPIRTASACSCSVCNSICCFYIRNRKSIQPCSCNHLKINVDYVQPVTKEEKEIKGKYNLADIIDYKKSDSDISSNTRYNLSDKINDKPKNKLFAFDKKDQDNPKVELSAQIMNVPYEEFKCSLSKRNNKCDHPHNNDSPIYKINDLVKPDILTRLKEVYKACSCKVCECITDKSLPIKTLPDESLPDKDLCNCTPCGCDECVNAQKIQKLDPRPHSGCPCVKCDRKDCRGVVKKSMEISACDCSPCDCLNCTYTSTISCTCEPCQCVECIINNTRRTPILPLNTKKNVIQSTCQCKPCECANCKQVYTTMAANLIQDMSNKCSYRYFKNDVYLNDLIEFDEDICECDQNGRCDSDPKYNDDHNSTTFINDQLIQTGYKNFNTIAMMAMYSTNYSKVEFNKTKDCKCLGCECLICTSRESEIKKKIYCNDFHNRNAVTSPFKSCDCEACQCEVCNQVQNKLAHNLIRLENNCSCSICDCIMCDNKVNSDKNDNIGVTSRARQNQSLPIHVTKDALSSQIYPLKKGKLLAPAMFDNEVYEPSCLKSQLCFSYNNFGQHKETRTYLNSKVSSNKILPDCQKSTNLKQIDVECENSQQYPNLNTEYPVKDIFSNNYLKNNNLHIGNTISKDFYVPNAINKSVTNKDAYLDSLEKYITETRTFGINSINCNEVACTITSNPFTCFDETQLAKIVNAKATTYHEVDNTASNQSILSIFESTSECNVSRTKNYTNINNYNLEIIHSNSEDENSGNYDVSKETIKAPKTEDVFNIKNRTERSKIVENKAIKYKYAYNKMYRRLIKRSQMNKKKKTLTKQTKINCINDKNENDTKVNIIENLKITVDDKNENNLELTIKNKKTVDDFFLSEMDMLNKIKTDIQNIDDDVLNKPWPILQKNFYVNCSEIRQNKGVCTIPDIESDVKHAVRFVSQEYDSENKGKNVQCKYSDVVTQTQSLTVQVDKEINCDLLASTENLQKNMKYLLDMVLSRAVPVCKVHGISDMFYPIEHASSDAPKVNIIDSCEGLKANIIELRTISNHSLLVRWKVPQKTAYIQGYELQVDGRSVKKIFSPTRCMAVLTCLPRCEKLLLTIRTLTTCLLSDHYPATTIVYRPRLK